MRFLADTNIVIKLDPPSTQHAEADAAEAMEFFRLATRHPHDVVVHPAIAFDFAKDTNEERARLTALVRSKYNELRSPPSADRYADDLGPEPHGSNEWVDNQLIAALADGHVDYLVTEDKALRRKLARVAPGDRCLSLAEALTLLQSLYDVDVVPPTHVDLTTMASLDLDDPIWASFRDDYPEFDRWFAEKRTEDRPAWIVVPDDNLAAVAIGKREAGGPSGLPAARVLKICSFKVADDAQGFKYGELLLKSIFQYAAENAYDRLYLTVFPHHGDLVALVEEFGFTLMATETETGEWVLVKRRVSTDDDLLLDPLGYHIALGPPAHHPDADDIYFVPIEPRYCKLLFPSPSAQPTLPGLALGSKAFGNAIKKAYLSRSPTRQLTSGSSLLFYRSHDAHSVTELGIVEEIVVSEDAEVIASFVGPRTVYSIAEIEDLTHEGPVLAVLFRHDREIKPRLTLEELIDNNALSAAPQSITSARREGLPWLMNRINGTNE